MEKIKTLTLLHIMNVLSLVFMVGNVFLRLFFEGNHYGGLFLWSVVMSVVALLLKKRSGLFGGALIPWVLLPALVEVPLYQMGYLLFVGIFMITLFYKNREDPHYDRVEFEFGVGIAITSVLLFFTVIMGGLRLFNNVAAGYLLIYLLSGVLMLRSLRYLEHTGDVQQLKKINFRAMGIILILSITLSTGVFTRFYQQLRSLLWIGYNVLIDFVLWVFYWPIYFIGSVINYIITTLTDMGGEPEGFGEEGSGDVVGDMEGVHDSLQGNALSDSPVFRILLGILILGLIFFALYKIYSRKAVTRGATETYTERKEVILPNKNRNLWKSIKNLLKPKSKEDRVRIYYQEFLMDLMEKGMVLLPSDTTVDILRKGASYYSEEELSIFRNIYIKVRYGEKAIDNKTYKEAKRIYERIIKKKESLDLR